MSFAQFTTDNVFDQNKTTTTQQSSGESTNGTFTPTEGDQSASVGVPGPGEHEEGPGNPGEPVPIDDYLPWLAVAGLALVAYYQNRSKKVQL